VEGIGRRGLLIGGALSAAALIGGRPASAAVRWSIPEHRAAARLQADAAGAARQLAALSITPAKAQAILAKLRARTGLALAQRGSALVTGGSDVVVPLGYVVKGEDYPYATDGPGSAAAVTTAPVRVALVDTGLAGLPRSDGWLTGSAGDADPLDVVAPLGRLDFGSGHGTFTAGIVQRVAPRADIRVYRFNGPDGLGTDQSVADTLVRAAAEGVLAGLPTIINASLGTPAVDGVPPPAMAAAIARIRTDYPDVLIVAAAGNLGSNEPVYPAAFDGVVAVGALTDGMAAAPFSSFGPWLTCSTVGVGIVSTFVPGVSPPEPSATQPDQAFGANAWAMWTGTSFSTPQIAGAVARYCYENPGTKPQAALDVLLAGQSTLAGYGRTLRLLPGTPTS
jgi:thermitase